MLVHAVHRQQIFGRLVGVKLLLRGNRHREQRVFGTSPQLLRDFLIEAFDRIHLLKRDISNLFQCGEAFLDQHGGNVFIDIQRNHEPLYDFPGLGLLLFNRLIHAHHIDDPASQIGSEADILAATTDGLRKIVLCHRDFHGRVVFIYDDGLHLSGGHGIDHQLRGVVVPENDVHAFVIELVRDRLNP